MAYIGKNPYTDAYTKAETDAKIVELAPPTKLSNGKSSMLSGSASVSNTTLMAGMSTTLYTGNGSTQSINAGVDLATQWGDTANETYGGLVWIKGRSNASNHRLFDTVRGVQNVIQTSSTEAQYTLTTGLSDFLSTGFTTGSYADTNTSTHTYASWIFQTTHKITGTTNHGKAYTCHYNPITGFTIVKYEGSGIAGHEIPHHLGRKLGLYTIKTLNTTENWYTSGVNISGTLALNTTNGLGTYSKYTIENNDILSLNTSGGGQNTSGNSYILYGWANSYYDTDNVLNGNYEIGTYQGTGASGNKITTRGKPAWVMVKAISAVSDWVITDIPRNNGDNLLRPNTSGAEQTGLDWLDIAEDGFVLNYTDATWNASGVQFLYMVAYDNDGASGKSKFDMISETSNLQLTNLVASFTNGVDANGVVNTIKNLGSFTVAPTGGWSL